MKTFIQDLPITDSSIIIAEEFRKKTLDGISAYICLDFPESSIPADYLIIGTEKSTDSSFEGIVFYMPKVNAILNNVNNRNKLLNITMQWKNHKLLFKNFYEWQKKIGAGIVNITTI